MRLPRGKYCIIPCTFQPEQEGDFILRVHVEQFGPEEESEDSDSDTLIETRALVDRSQYGSSTGQGNQLYGRTGERGATPLYGSRLQLEQARAPLPLAVHFLPPTPGASPLALSAAATFWPHFCPCF